MSPIYQAGAKKILHKFNLNSNDHYTKDLTSLTKRSAISFSLNWSFRGVSSEVWFFRIITDKITAFWVFSELFMSVFPFTM